MTGCAAETGLSDGDEPIRALHLLPLSDRDKDAEILVLRHQIVVLERHLNRRRVRFTPGDRALLAALLHRMRPQVLRQIRLLVRPDTVFRWLRNLLRRRHAARAKSKRPGRPPTVGSIRVSGTADGPGEPELGVPAHPRRTAGPGREGGRLDRAGNPPGRWHRPRPSARPAPGLAFCGRRLMLCWRATTWRPSPCRESAFTCWR
jgi:hypothetical protein